MTVKAVLAQLKSMGDDARRAYNAKVGPDGTHRAATYHFDKSIMPHDDTNANEFSNVFHNRSVLEKTARIDRLSLVVVFAFSLALA